MGMALLLLAFLAWASDGRRTQSTMGRLQPRPSAGFRPLASAAVSHHIDNHEKLHVAPAIGVSPNRASEVVMEEGASEVVMETKYKLNNDIFLSGPFKCIGSHVMVRHFKPKGASAGGVLLTNNETNTPTDGIVISAGPGEVDPDTGVLIPLPVKEGDHCVFAEFVGNECEYNNEPCIIVGIEDIVGCYEGGEVSVDAFRPIDEYVMIAMNDAAEEVTDSGVVVVLGKEDQDQSGGLVVKVGPGKTSTNGVQPCRIAPGDRVKFKEFESYEQWVAGEKFTFVRASDCLAKWS